MTDRKKLMDMICEAVQTYRCVGNCNHPHCNTVQILCDHLISKGVEIPVRCEDCRRWKRTGDCRHGICCLDGMKLFKWNYEFCNRGERKDNG